MSPRHIAVALAGACLAFGAVACGSGGPRLSPLAAKGRDTAHSAGCTACHGADGQGGVGPAWTGLAGSHVDLADGTRVVADDAYLRRSIRHPSAQKVQGYDVQMPTVRLSNAQVDAIVAYLHALG